MNNLLIRLKTVLSNLRNIVGVYPAKLVEAIELLERIVQDGKDFPYITVLGVRQVRSMLDDCASNTYKEGNWILGDSIRIAYTDLCSILTNYAKSVDHTTRYG